METNKKVNLKPTMKCTYPDCDCPENGCGGFGEMKQASLPLPANLPLANPSEELREKFIKYLDSRLSTNQDEIFDWFTPYISKDADEVKELRAEIEKWKDYGRDREMFVTTESIDALRNKIISCSDEAAGNLKEGRSVYVSGFKDGYYKCLNTQILPSQHSIRVLESELSELKSKLSLQPVNEWVSVETRLPEIPDGKKGFVECLAFTDRVIMSKYNTRTGNFLYNNFDTIDGVIAWMLLPNPPKTN